MLQEFLETRYPELRGQVQGGNYPPPPLGVAATQLASLTQWSAIALAMAGPTILGAFGVVGGAEPEWYTWFCENKMTAFIGIFFANSVAQNMATTGAFEVEVDGRVVFSKLASGRMPTAGDLVRGLETIGLHQIDM